jgi:hypothetical protein
VFILKKFLLIPVTALALTSIGSGTSFAATDNPIPAVQKVDSPCSISQQIPNPASTPYALLDSGQHEFYGSGKITFNYPGNANLLVFVKNTGNSSFKYSIINAWGYAIESGYLNPGGQTIREFTTWGDDLPIGNYSILVSNSDGSKGIFQYAARSLEFN